MSRDTIIGEVHRIFIDCCTHLFVELGCEVNEVEGDPDELAGAPFGYIDAGSNDLELTVALRLPLSVLILTYPVIDGASSPDEATLEDWVSELTNQLIGKIKRRLLQHDCTIKIGLPMALFGANIDEAMPADAVQLATFLTVDHELCECRLAIEIFNDDMVFAAAVEEADDSGGELEFF